MTSIFINFGHSVLALEHCLQHRFSTVCQRSYDMVIVTEGVSDALWKFVVTTYSFASFWRQSSDNEPSWYSAEIKNFTHHQSCQKISEIPDVMRRNKVYFSYSQLLEKILKSWLGILQVLKIRNVMWCCRSVLPPCCALQSSHTLPAIPFLCFWIQHSSIFLECNSLFSTNSCCTSCCVAKTKQFQTWKIALDRQGVLKINPMTCLVLFLGQKKRKKRNVKQMFEKVKQIGRRG